MCRGINSRRAARSRTGAAGKGAKRKLYRSRREGGPSLAEKRRLSPGRRWPESGSRPLGGGDSGRAGIWRPLPTYRGLEGAFDGPAVPSGVRGQKAAASHPGCVRGAHSRGCAFLKSSLIAKVFEKLSNKAIPFEPPSVCCVGAVRLMPPPFRKVLRNSQHPRLSSVPKLKPGTCTIPLLLHSW